MRTPFVVGNWKLHKTLAESLALVTELKNQLAAVKGVQVGVAPVFTALASVAKRLEGSPLVTCAQDCYWEAKGAFTGEVSAPLVADTGATWAIVGHSERRQFFGDTNDGVGKKARAALAAGLGALADLPSGVDLGSKLVIAYEPVWAIGTGRTATPGQAQEVHAHIRKRLEAKLGGAVAGAVRIQYGGSVKPSNAEALIAEPDIDGALVGGASLEAADFVAIVKAARGST
jgi:triosephosphate isomerase